MQKEPSGSIQMAAVEPKWAKGVSSSTRGDAWSMAFQIRGKRHALTLRCSQAEAAVAYDLAGCWAHKEKGNDALRCSSYNFPLAFYPPTLLSQLLSGALGGWEGVKAFVARLAGAGALRQLVPFEGAGRRFRIADAEAWRPQPDCEVCFNVRGVHFFRGASWVCVPMDDVQSFGSSGRFLQLTYASGPVGRPGRSAVAHTFRCADAGGACGELQAVAAQRRQAGLPAPRDLGDRIVLPQGAALAAADFGLFGDVQSAKAEWGGQPAAPASPSECGSLGDAEPSAEEVELFAQFADMARSLSRDSERVEPGSAGSRAGSVDAAAGPAAAELAAAAGPAGGSTCPPSSPSSEQVDEKLLPPQPQAGQQQQQQQHCGTNDASQHSSGTYVAPAAASLAHAPSAPADATAPAAAGATDVAGVGSPTSSRVGPPEAAAAGPLAGSGSEQGQQSRKRPAVHDVPCDGAQGLSSPAAKKQRTEPGAAAAAAGGAAVPAAPAAGVLPQPICSVRPLSAGPAVLPAMVALLHQQQEAALKAAAAAAKAGTVAAPPSPNAHPGAAAPGFRPVAMLPMPVVLPPAVQKQALAAMQAHAARLQAAALAAAGTKAAPAAPAGAGQAATGRGLPMMIPVHQFVAAAAAAQQQLMQQQKQAPTQPQAAR
ncbi:hypothetical protein ABPG77_008094 [Micractinium sp. CCAP 211/92]